MKYYIFDIDGTLLHTNSDGKNAFFTAFEKQFGIKLAQDISFVGGMDNIIYKHLLDSNFIPIYSNTHDEDKKNALFIRSYNKFKELYINELEKNYKLSNKRRGKKWIIYEKVHELLDFLHKNGDKILCVTGNMKLGAEFKLNVIGKINCFDYISHCDMHKNRYEILKTAIDYIKDNNSNVNIQDDIYFIGDAPADMEAAKEANVSFLGIGNRFSSLQNKYDDYLYFNNFSKFYKYMIDKQSHNILN